MTAGTGPAPRLVLYGVMGQSPFAGVAWQVLHYLEGFRRAGYDVWYVEDTGEWPFDPERNAVTADCSYTLAYLARVFDWLGLPDRWAYRSAPEGGRVHGLSESQVRQLLDSADLLVNVTGATVLRDDHLRVPVRLYVETDPVLPQIELVQGRPFTVDLLAAHTHFATFAENLGADDCLVPVPDLAYVPTRQPVVIDWWDAGRTAPPVRGFTTVASWRQSGKDVEWAGEAYTWSKHHEFLKLLDLPRQAGAELELALARLDEPSRRLLETHGWRVIDAVRLSLWIEPYRQYLCGSAGEFTVAKDQNVRLRSGWFSDRSACYLAAGRPVITQSTGFENVLPTGQGLFAFRSADDVAAAIEAIAADPVKHSTAAREIAEELFSAQNVVTSLLERLGICA